MCRALSSNFSEKAPGQNWEKIIVLMSKLGKNIDIKHNYGSKIHPENQVIFVCFKYHSGMGHWFSKVLVVCKKQQQKTTKQQLFLTFLIGKNRHAIGEKGRYFSLGMGLKFRIQLFSEHGHVAYQIKGNHKCMADKALMWTTRCRPACAYMPIIMAFVNSLSGKCKS